MRIRITLLMLVLCLLLVGAACGKTADTTDAAAVQETEAPTPTPTPAPTPEPTPIAVAGSVVEDGTLRAVVEADDFALIEQLDSLTTLDVTGSVCYDAITAYQSAHPDVEVIYTVQVGDVSVSPDTASLSVPAVPDASVLAYLPALHALTVEEPMTPKQAADVLALRPDVDLKYSVSVAGMTLAQDVTELNLSEVSPALAGELAEAIAVLPDVTDIELNHEDGTCDWLLPDIGLLQEVRTSICVHATVTAFDRTFCLTDDVVSFNKIPMQDRKDELLAILPQLRNVGRLDMEYCGLSDEEMAALREQFPTPKIAWMITLGAYSFRSDSKMLRLNKYNYITMLTDENVQQLSYCNEVKYLDLGHNHIQHPDFIANMPDLEVVILAIEQPTDLSAFANCPNLEYAELFNGHVTDVSPLANCKHLKHLNLCMNQITDITPLYGLDELERFWISRNRELPKEQIEKFKELHPNCVVNTTTVDPTDPPWRYKANGEKSKRYALLRAQMGYNRDLIYSLVEPDKNN